MMCTPLRSPKMYGFIFGFQRWVWWPKCAPASSNCCMVTSDDAMVFLLPVLPLRRRESWVSGETASHRYDGIRMWNAGALRWCTGRNQARLTTEQNTNIIAFQVRGGDPFRRFVVSTRLRMKEKAVAQLASILFFLGLLAT